MSRMKPTKEITGFTLLAEAMAELFRTLRPKASAPPTARGMLSIAQKQLSSNFQANARGQRAANPPVNNPTTSPTSAAVAVDAPPTNVSSSTRFTRSSIEPSSDAARYLVSPVALYSHSDDEIGRNNVPLSSQNRGMKRLEPEAIVNLRVSDDIIIVVPPVNRREPKEAKAARVSTIALFKRIVFNECGNIPVADKNEMWDDELKKREIIREGKCYHEFNVVITSYAERFMLQTPNLNARYIEYYMGTGGAGLAVSLNGYSTSNTLLLKFNTLPFLEVHRSRPMSSSPESFLDESIVFPTTSIDADLTSYLMLKLDSTRGDPVAYIEVLMKYYHRAFEMAKKTKSRQVGKKKKSFIPQTEGDGNANVESFRAAIASELDKDNLQDFANKVDKEYAEAIESCYGFCEVKGYLMDPTRCSEYYEELRERFPLCHLIFATIVSTRQFSVSSLATPSNTEPSNSTAIPNAEKSDDDNAPTPNDNQLHKKERMMLFLFLALLRTRSRYLLSHWASIEPLGHYFKGHQQPGRNSLSGSFSMTLRTCWARQKVIYDKYIPTFNQELEAEQTTFGSYDNHNEVLQKKNPTDGKNAITHIGTSYYAIKAKPIDLPVGTVVRSPHGVEFNVTSCEKKTQYQYLVLGSPLTHPNSIAPHVVADKNIILTGVVWPEVGWEIVSMPGFTTRPPLTYHKQKIQLPLLAWVEEGATDTDILFCRKRKWKEPAADGARSFNTNKMHNVTLMSRRIIDMSSHSLYLKQKRNSANEDSCSTHLKKSKRNNGATPKPSPVVYDKRTEGFMHVFEAASSEVDCAVKFETDLIRLVNPNSAVVDRMFAWPIAPFCETSHDGMKKVFTQLMQSFRMVDVNDSGLCVALRNAKRRRIHFFGDGLSARNFSCLKYNISRQLATLSCLDSVKALLQSLDRCTMQMDYLHENGFHKQDCIWRSKYGCFLQAFQVHLGWKRINGDPSKRNMQGHELFLSIILRALRTHRLTCFIQSCSDDEFDSTNDLTPREELIRVEELYSAYCDELETSSDEPSRLCAIFMKEVESYFRCVHGTKKGNVWLMEKENSDWLGAYKFAGKTNYVPEAMKRAELMNGDKLTDWEIETIRRNRLLTLTLQGNKVSFDELVELLNLWNKGSISPPNFATKCYHSGFVMAARKCAYETFGVRLSATGKATSQSSATELMINLFEEASIFQVFSGGARTMVPNFFWDYVQRPENVGSQADKELENVELSDGHKILFQQLCKTDEQQNYFETFDARDDEDDDDLVSVVSSTFGSDDEDDSLELDDEEGPGDGDDWGDLDGPSRDVKIGDSLKRLGNVAKKCMSKHILSDMLGVDGDKVMVNVKEAREDKLKKELRKLNTIYMSVLHFDRKMKKRLTNLNQSLHESKTKTYSRKSYDWRDRYDEIMEAKQQQDRDTPND